MEKNFADQGLEYGPTKYWGNIGRVILMGNLNAKIGKDNIGKEKVMGRHGDGIMNENGELFSDTCAFNSLVIGGSIFPQ